MTSRPPGLPDYQNPPIDEVAIGVQFPPLDNFHDAHAGLYWQKVRQNYPKVENQPRIEGPIESEDSGPSKPISIQIPIGVSQNRTWLISDNDEYLIQVQNTRFVQNWRRRGTTYPHFEDIWGLFYDHYQKFKELLDSEGLPSPLVQQVEVTYINWITGLSPSRFLRSGSVTGISAYERQVEPEDQALNMRYRLDLHAEIIERLYVQCQPAIRRQEPEIKGSQFALTYKAAKVGGLTDGEVQSYAEAGRVIVVNAFTDLTTSEAHDIWGKLS